MAPLDKGALGLVLAALPLRVLLALTTDLSPDEAYYLAVSRLGLAFPDHPPLTPWLAGLADGVASLPVELRVRWPALLLGTAFGWLVIELVRRRGGDTYAQRWAAAFAAWFALPLAGGFLMTPDVILLPAVVGTAVLLEQDHLIDAAGPSTARTQFIQSAATTFAIAALCFAGMTAKVSMLFAAGAALVASKHWHVRAALAVSVAVSLPLAGPSLAFQADHALVDPTGHVGAAGAVVAALAAQLGLWGPAVAWFGWRHAMRQRFDGVVIAGIGAAVIVSAVVRGVAPEPNWFAPAAVMLAAGASHVMHVAPRWLRITTVILGPVLAIVFASHVIRPWLPVSIRLDPSARLHGWRSGNGPEQAPGTGAYGPAAEACIYLGDCSEILDISDR